MKNGSYPRSCDPDAKKCIVFSEATSHCPDLSGWEGIRKSGKSEDLPELILVEAFGGKAIVMTPNSFWVLPVPPLFILKK